MANPLSVVNEVAREEWLSTDFVTAQTLASAQAQDLLRDDGRSDDSRLSNTFPYTASGSGSPINGASLASILFPSGGFGMDITPGEAFWDTGSLLPLSGGVSSYLVTRWEAQTLSFAAPDPTNPRVDLVYASVSSESTNLESRNILLDPVARTVGPANVPKRVSPVATLVVVSGTAAAAPTAPALPGGSNIPIYEIFVPAAAASSANFLVAKQTPRRCTYPMSTAHGILQGVEFTSNFVDETTTSSALFVGYNPGDGASKVVIDGEVIAFDAGDSATGPLNMITQDAGGNNPFAAPAPATNDKPYYIYACGGRHLRQGRTGFSAGVQGYFPVCFVESLVAPTRDGRPSANITTPRGVTQAGALYVAIGFVVQNTTRRKGCAWTGDWVLPLTGSTVGLAAFNDNATRTFSNAAITTHTLAAKPAPSTEALINLTYTNSIAGSSILLGHSIATTVFTYIRFLVNAAPYSQLFSARIPMSGFTNVAVGIDPQAATASALIYASGYNMLVKRYCVSV